MKRITKYVLMSLALCVTLVSAILAEKCERLEMYELPCQEFSMTEDLTSGLWLADLDGYESTLSFRTDGLVEIITDGDEGDEYSQKRWTLRIDNDDTLLSLLPVNGEIEKFGIEPTCDGFALLDEEGDLLAMVKSKSNIRSHVQNMRSQIQGIWKTSTPKSRKEKMDLQWSFAENGKFALNVGPDRHHSTFNGEWDVTHDASSIILRFADTSDPDRVLATKLVKIHALDFEDMIMSGEPLANIAGVQKRNTKMFFEKKF